MGSSPSKVQSPTDDVFKVLNKVDEKRKALKSTELMKKLTEIHSKDMHYILYIVLKGFMSECSISYFTEVMLKATILYNSIPDKQLATLQQKAFEIIKNSEQNEQNLLANKNINLQNIEIYDVLLKNQSEIGKGIDRAMTFLGTFVEDMNKLKDTIPVVNDLYRKLKANGLVDSILKFSQSNKFLLSFPSILSKLNMPTCDVIFFLNHIALYWLQNNDDDIHPDALNKLRADPYKVSQLLSITTTKQSIYAFLLQNSTAIIDQIKSEMSNDQSVHTNIFQ